MNPEYTLVGSIPIQAQNIQGFALISALRMENSRSRLTVT